MTDRTGMLKQLMESKFTLNQSGDVRILENTDSTSGVKGYVNKLKNRNLVSFSQTLNGFNSP